jgi:AAA domain/Nuclease-related domain
VVSVALTVERLRRISPPPGEFARLRQPLTAGERELFEFFDRHLPLEWEIYIQPHLNGLRPDFVLLHPEVGIAVFEVKDWNLQACDWRIEPGTVRPDLVGTDSNGRRVCKANPFDRLALYRAEITRLYCPAFNRSVGIAPVSAGLIFPFADDKELKERFDAGGAHIARTERRHFVLAGRDALASQDVSRMLPTADQGSAALMTPAIAADLRHWLVEPDVSAEQRRAFVLSAAQRTFVNDPTKTGYRRLRGPAGSGKTVVLAGRVAKLREEKKSVLVVSYNITLLNYLRDCATRFGVDTNAVTWLHFHAWCKRVAYEAGRQREQSHIVNEELLPNLTSSILRESQGEQYDAILVDEGQDFSPGWWNVLREAVRPGGEMLLVADRAQDLYGRNALWTEQRMLGSGFNGPWATLEGSYRLPVKLANLTNKFVSKFLPTSDVHPPSSPNQQALDVDPAVLRWVQVDPGSEAQAAFEAIRTSVGEKNGDAPAAFADVVFLCQNTILGRQVVESLTRVDINVVHTFAENAGEARQQKLYFFKGDARVKATTIHSFKGWEARHLVVVTGDRASRSALSGVYTAMTRLKSHPEGSHLTVVSSANALESFGREWPIYVDARAGAPGSMSTRG